ncbi:MAG: thioredoxin-disulfide reductase [Bdellovibrionales bacterium GWA2_49_15]|nr:MAG: thioredoxin-disulfide reductase [Bdellovibrionales bacterium GWA2_49_15]HAZ13320.1 thioredoxin-disulfide reductase [Bdellovibrionales bacterium]
MKQSKLIIIGSGPAGHTAALYAARANLVPIVLEGIQPGGQLTTTTEVENFPGFEHGITGPALMENMRKQALRFGTTYLSKTVTRVDFKKKPFQIFDNDGQQYLTETVILATGASALYLGLPHEKELIGKGVSACATCDGFFYKNRIVYVVGGGDTAMEEATFLTKFASKVYLVHRRDQFRASKPMQDRVKQNPKIECLMNCTVSELKYDSNGLNGIVITHLITGDSKVHQTDGLFLAIGHTPNTHFLQGQLSLDEKGFIKTINGSPETEIPGVFAAGDVQDSYYRQAITAAGSGCQAAIRAERYLSELDIH